MRTSIVPVVAAVIVAAVAGMLPAANRAYAQAQPSAAELQREINQLQAKLDALQALDQKVEVLDKRVDTEQQDTTQKFGNLPKVKADANGITVGSPDGDFNLRVHGLIQVDSQSYTNGDDKKAPGGVTSSTFLINRARAIFEGTVFKNYDYHLEPDFGLGTTVLQDAWLDAHPLGDAVRFEAGKFKSPFGLERLQQDTNLLFIQRGLTTNLIPNRDIGFMFHGSLLDQVFTYQLAFLNGVPNNTASVDADTNDGKDFVGRVFFQPLKETNVEFVRGLGVGLAGTYGDENGALSKYKSSGQSTFFSYVSGSGTAAAPNATAYGERHRISPQAYYYVGPFGLLGDYVNDTQDVRLTTTSTVKKVTTTNKNDETFANHAWQIQAGFMLTGENESYYGVKPAHDFNPLEGGWGAWEIKARFGSLDVDHDAFAYKFASDTTSAERATEYAGGLNWYLSQNIKLDFEYLWTAFFRGATHGNRPGEGAFLTQAQIAF
jgi:phosphate-selective porin OprO and OprP